MRKLRSKWTNEKIDDMNSFEDKSFYECLSVNKNDEFLIRRGSDVRYFSDSYCIFNLTEKQLRKIKIEILHKTLEGNCWKKILKKCKKVSSFNIYEKIMVDELTKEINNNIERLKNMYNDGISN